MHIKIGKHATTTSTWNVNRSAEVEEPGAADNRINRQTSDRSRLRVPRICKSSMKGNPLTV